MAPKIISDFADAAVSSLPPLCTTSEAADFLRVSRRHLYRYISAGRLPTIQHGSRGQVLIPKTGLAAYLRASAVQA
jgi:excisionase family DNA binding protein